MKTNLTQRNVKSASTQDALRPAMQNAAYYDAEAGRLVATDGHVLVAWPVDVDDEAPADVSAIIPLEAFPSKKVLNPEITTYLDDDKRVKVSSSFTGSPVVYEAIEERYPNYKAVTPDIEDSTFRIGFDLDVLERLLQAIPRKRGQHNSVALHFTSPNRAVLITPNSQVMREAFDYALAMPVMFDRGDEAASAMERLPEVTAITDDELHAQQQGEIEALEGRLRGAHDVIRSLEDQRQEQKTELEQARQERDGYQEKWEQNLATSGDGQAVEVQNLKARLQESEKEATRFHDNWRREVALSTSGDGQAVEVPVPAVPEQPEALTLEEYSEKALVLRGPTKEHAVELKALWGSFNPHLKGGAGWIFSKKRRTELEAFIAREETARV